MKTTKTKIIKLFTMLLLTVTILPSISFLNATTALAATAASIKYSTHIQGIGWQSEVYNGETAGTTGEGLRMEAIKISLDGIGGDIEYNTHIEGDGWISSSSNGQISGTEGQSKAMQAIKISLSGEVAISYHVYYRLHVAGTGWLGWAHDGEIAGTTGGGVQAEAIQIKLVPRIGYTANVQNIGWMETKYDEDISGTVGEGLRMEALNIHTGLGSDSMSYRVHVQDIGWMDWTDVENTTGALGQSLGIQAIQIQLNGYLETQYDIYYRAHVQNIGWMDWRKNGETAGTTGQSLNMEAIQIKFVPKGMDINQTAYIEYTNQEQQNYNLGQQIANLAYGFLGVPYVYGGADPSGFDCSGFTFYLHAQFGIYIGKNSADQGHAGGVVDGVSNALPGDIIYFPGHVGIYIGNNLMIHASKPGDYVKISNVYIMNGLPIISIRRYW